MRTKFAALRVPLMFCLALAPLPVLGASGALTPSPWTVIYQHDEHLVSQRTLPNGDTEYAYAELPRSAVAETSEHAAQPAGHHQQGAGAIALSEPVDCNIQGAYAWHRLCGINRVHWSGTHPAIYFIDFTGVQWPVYESVVQWNQSTALDVGYVPSSVGGCNHTHCVRVTSGSFTDSCGPTTVWAGCTDVRVAAGTTLITNETNIRLNNLYASTYSDNRSTTCHEIGHALGLDHNLYTNSCLYWNGGSLYPSNSDYLMLEDIY